MGHAAKFNGLRVGVATFGAMLLLVACGQREEILEGERFDLRDGFLSQVERSADDLPVAIRLPGQVANASWTHRAGDADHHITHPALGAGTTVVWSAEIGQGNDRRHRITADPVVAGGLVFTLDSRAAVQATDAATGAVRWRADLTPPGERADDASGGGLAVGGGVLYVTTGFGELVALDAATGSERWRQDFGAAATGAPTVFDGKIYVSTKDNRGWAVRAEDGRIDWQFAATPSPSSLVGGAGPAVADGMAVFPFSSGELVSVFAKGGTERWRTPVAGRRPGFAYTRVSDITADPVLLGDTVYSGNQSGRVVAMSAGSGELVWSANEGAYSPLWVTTGAIFLISDQGALVRLDRASGQTVWSVAFPGYENDNPRRIKDVYAYYGPVLAGGKLWVGFDSGSLRAFSPETGAELVVVEVPSGAARNPVVAGGTLYLVTQNGQLLALR
ncbi:PQQ-binding-like beta-propeller repeat protein [Aliiroseovarius sp. PTFE2010]|uniref:outer membrane protein assembly factor BamB family protein n=1 Tax=Aliiroseovarius sp. PTFE2010 TaxID=3417190 RepID=UPI003CE7B4C5